jgi:hypothetical protein
MTTTETTTETGTMSPAEIDRILEGIWTKRIRAAGRVEFYSGSGARSFRASEYLAEAQAEVAELDAAAAPYEAEFVARGGWRRYFVVNSSNGHVHRERNCSTYYATTTFGWIPELSGCDESAMVAEYGEMACTVCFPDAPTMRGFGDGTSALARLGDAERAARDAAKIERDAAKAAKTLDEPIRVSNWGWKNTSETETISTVHAAKAKIKSYIDGAVDYPDHMTGALVETETRRLSEALAAKGIDTAPLIAKWTKAAAKRAQS